ncbi:hypothetical protein EG329_007250 [Mollisiaceae sp. DMI_Dod_QoI]|nr:hypothetical protein EG329_007250 [Helotiales sp. DMI_Dod_QoI]
MALNRKFPYTKKPSDCYIVEVIEFIFIKRFGRAMDRFDLGYRHLWAFAIWEYYKMPTDPKKKGKDLLAKAKVFRADEKVLLKVANYDPIVLEANIAQIVRLFAAATSLPKHLFILYLHADSEEKGEEVTSFFMRRFVYFAFFGKSPDLVMESSPDLSPSPPGQPRAGAVASQGPEVDEVERSRRQREREELDRAEAEREQERLDQERLEREKLEREKLERETLERETLEREILERERLKRERLDQERERLDQERLELRRNRRQQQQEKQEQEKEEEERQRQAVRERGRREQEALIQGRTLDDLGRARKRHTQIDMESLTPGAFASGRELVVADPSSNIVRNLQEGLEQERLEQERLEQERVENERVENERLERLEQERLEQERVENERLEQERLERERLQENFVQELRKQEKIDKEQQDRKKREQEQERRERDKRKGERQRRERREQGRWEEEKIIESEGGPVAESTNPRPRRRQDPTPPAQTPDSVWITFKIREQGGWRTAQSLLVYSSDPSEVERIAVKYMRKREQIRVYDTDLNILTPQMCFQAAIANGSNMLLLIPEKEIDINEELEASVSHMLSEPNSEMEAVPLFCSGHDAPLRIPEDSGTPNPLSKKRRIY